MSSNKMQEAGPQGAALAELECPPPGITTINTRSSNIATCRRRPQLRKFLQMAAVAYPLTITNSTSKA